MTDIEPGFLPKEAAIRVDPTLHYVTDTELAIHEADTSTHGVSQIDGVTERNAAISAHSSTTSTHGVTEIDGVTERNAAIATHTANASAHHTRYTDGETDARIAVHVALSDPHGQYQLESERDANSGYPILDSAGGLLVKGSTISAARNGSNEVLVNERTSGESAIKVTRSSANTFVVYINYGSAWKQLLTEVSGVYVDRGDLSAVDLTVSEGNKNANFHDWDLSSICPAGTKSVLISIFVSCDAAGKNLYLRKNGNSNMYALSGWTTQTTGSNQQFSQWVACDTNRVIEYYVQDTHITNAIFTVMGWML